MAAQPLLGTVRRRPREPGVLDDFLQLGQGQLTQAAGPHEHRRMPVEMARGEERCRLVLDQRLLLGLVRKPEHDDIALALAAIRVDRVGSRVPEEDEGLATHLVDRVILRTADNRHVRHCHGERVYVIDTRGTSPVRHSSSVCVQSPPQGQGLRTGRFREALAELLRVSSQVRGNALGTAVSFRRLMTEAGVQYALSCTRDGFGESHTGESEPFRQPPVPTSTGKADATNYGPRMVNRYEYRVVELREGMIGGDKPVFPSDLL